ncbi:glutamate--cysteine ligase [Hahella sp. CR1]|uniref:glutamate--cysteine ligase n=1 Tax=Hahella sp. CR1 TaxID=2992807 RepID=UPI002443717F|nr:glutamate--cysteine ligase [Hahella sp. CR1]MDG9667035.1 glutamate--cysteine ligase [Hahella sp. CR1]
MSEKLAARLEKLRRRHPQALADIYRGIEKEGLRVDSKGFIAQSDHPQALGSALTHPNITTDYSEALLELITPVTREVDELLTSLQEIHQFVHANLPAGESLWAGSMPSLLDGDESIRIAEYGESNLGKIKHVYRRGLAYRYGRIMQSIAGVHFNFSLGDDFWRAYQEVLAQSAPLQEFKSESYFSLIRNFRRWSWLLMYLFGASPALDRSFLSGRDHKLDQFGTDTLGLPHATSLRMSDLGYQNNAQSSLKICFNHLNTYVKTLYDATHTPFPRYEAIGLQRDGEYIQLNANLLQIENEYYNTIRPKRVAQSGEKPIQALKRRGIEYIEVRCLDLDPFSPIGVSESQIRFLDAFLLTCLLSDSAKIVDEECSIIEENFLTAVSRGRDADVELVRLQQSDYVQGGLQEWALRILEQVELCARELDAIKGGDSYAAAIRDARAKVNDPSLTPSARTYAAVANGQGYVDWTLAMSQAHHQTLTANPLSPERMQHYVRAGEQSWADERALREADNLPFDAYLKQYLTYV